MTHPWPQFWQTLVTAALVGTDRQPIHLPADSPLAELFPPQPDDDPAIGLLNLAAAAAPYRAAGQAPLSDHTPFPPPCPPDQHARCSPEAGYFLSRMLQGDHSRLLGEWLTVLAENGQRIPEEYLPDLMSLGRSKPRLRLAIKQVLGGRGEWLAAQNPDWAYLITEPQDTVWQTGTQAARVLLLETLRTTDPAQARRLLQSTWSEEDHRNRATFLNVMQANLSLDDEPFLETALDDRRREVRQVAAQLLAHLPDSRLSRRMVIRTQPLITFSRAALTRRGVIRLTLPESCDSGMRRDGIDPKPRRTALGEKAWWMLQLLAATPVTIWQQTWRASPEEIVKAAGRSEWELILLEGWALAAARSQNADWAEALLTACLNHAADVTLDSLENLVQTLPLDRRETFVLDRLRTNRNPLRGDHPALLLLSLCRHAWGETLSHAVLQHLKGQINQPTANAEWQLRALLPEFARHFHPALLPEADAILTPFAEESQTWAKVIGQFLTVVKFRGEMLKAF